MFVLKLALWALFFGASVLLAVIILLQEGKGGGLAEAFGGVGAETFGVKSGGINRFTFSVAAAYVVAAILLHATWDL
ncbi:MAG: preprotein translocase subunit SecG [Planctomycetota bacterium]|nr:preprotein translocase subunit SecG [Planctomycetota bacterium]MDA0932193.1 preprotein translocase subunit SecG [Planctomycetota bacterium]MDA1223062.1 preprotein translocase subunit SecG [Planctomycetota bacterium]